jgi:hypothetical protein
MIVELLLAGSAVSTGAQQTLIRKNWRFDIIASEVTSGATIEIQYLAADELTWVTLHTVVITEDGTTTLASANMPLRSLRANITSYTDGVYTVVAEAL